MGLNHPPHLSRRSLAALGLSGAAVGMFGITSAHAQPTDQRLVAPNGLRLDSAEFSRLYGPGVFIQTQLANIVIGTMPSGQNNVVSYRFRATIDGLLDRVRLYLAVGPGYSKGTGGKIRLSLRADDGSGSHLPALQGSPLAQAVISPNLTRGARDRIEEYRMDSSTAPLQRGQLYHLVMENIDANPAANFISADTAATPTGTNRPARWLDPTDWSVLMGSRTPTRSTRRWRDMTVDGTGNKHFSPIMQLTTVDGASQGAATIESGSVTSPKARIRTISGGDAIRERFTPSTRRAISGISVAAAAQVAGALGWRLLQGGTTLASGRFTQSTANHSPVNVGRYRVLAATWYDAALPSTVTLEAGQPYDLELRAEGNSRWCFGGQRNGSTTDFSWPAAFTESEAQHLVRGTWQPYYWAGHSAAPGTNWQVVLHQAP